MKRSIATLMLALMLCFASACKKPVTAPVPGTINTFDAYAARAVGDAQAALVSAKTWEFCSDQSFPATVTFDGNSYQCDKTAGPFPVAGRPYLYKAEQAFAVAQSAAYAYHTAASSDTTGLSQALVSLGAAIGDMLTTIGKGH